MTRQRLLRVSVPALLVGSALAGGGELEIVCQNDKNDNGGQQQDSGCTSGEPICVDADRKVNRQEGGGVGCAPCANYFESPMEPDWGCSPSEPICVDRFGNRPSFGSAGASCVPYPCHNTKEDPTEIDDGCTPAHPTCVDALGNDPPQGKPGIKCISHEQTEPLSSSKNGGSKQSIGCNPIPAWGIQKSKRVKDCVNNNNNVEANFFGKRRCLLSGEVDPPWIKAGEFSLCHGCPFGKSGGQCDIGKFSW